MRHISNRASVVVGHSERLGRGVIIICGHAPTVAAPAKDKDAFWDSIESISLEMAGAYPGYLRVSGIDGNGRVSGHENLIGNCVPEKFTNNGERRLGHLTASSMMATNTFYRTGYTWRSKHCIVARIDYALLGVEDAPFPL